MTLVARNILIKGKHRNISFSITHTARKQTKMLSEAATIIVVVTVVLGITAVVAVALRLYCRRLQKLPLGSDDYCVIVALVRT